MELIFFKKIHLQILLRVSINRKEKKEKKRLIVIIKGEKKVKNFEFDAGMDPRGGPKGSRPNSDCKERQNVKKFEFDAKMGPILIAIVKREKNVKMFEFDAETDPGGGPKGPITPLDF